MNSTPLEDGSTAFYDDQGHLLYIIDKNGNRSEPDGSIARDFVGAVTSIFSSVIRSDFGIGQPAGVTPAAAPAAASSVSPAMQYLLLGALAFLLYKALA